MSTRLWGGRFEGEPSEAMLAFTVSLGFDRVLARDDCAVLAAHARALARAGVLADDEAASAATALREIGDEIASGAFVFEPGDEDVHTAVERALLARLPEIAPKVRAGLSRNDRVAAALRVWLRREGRALVEALAVLIETLVARAREHADALMPGYTHLQRAQPVRLAHHLLAHAFALERDAGRFTDALRRADASPLGAGALAGSTLGLDAAVSATDLGFGRPLANSIDAVAARDFVAEFLAAAAICGVHLSRLGEEIVLWVSSEFGFAELSDATATGSSLMPQKKNPDVAELARGKAGRLIGNLTGLLVTLKGLPLAYNRDLQEDKEPLFDSVETLRLMLPALTEMIAQLRFDTDRMARAASDGALLATDLAEHLVRAGMPFRQAHEVVGRVVQRAASQGKPLDALGDDELGALGVGQGAREALNARTSLDRRPAPGPSAASVEAQLAGLTARLAAIRDGD